MMPSTREIAVVSLAGIVATLVIAGVFDLGEYPAVLVAAGLSLNYWAARGLWRHRHHRVIRIEEQRMKAPK